MRRFQYMTSTGEAHLLDSGLVSRYSVRQRLWLFADSGTCHPWLAFILMFESQCHPEGAAKQAEGPLIRSRLVNHASKARSLGLLRGTFGMTFQVLGVDLACCLLKILVTRLGVQKVSASLPE